MKTIRLFAVSFVSLLLFSFCTQQSGIKKEASLNAPVPVKKTPAELAQYSKATFAAGCFWCAEAVFESVKGVQESVSGYAGGDMKNPTYEAVGNGGTGHAESVEVYYDSTVVNFKTLLRVLTSSMDPTQVNGQGPDRGTQYRSIIFYRNPAEKQIAEQYIAELNNSGKYNKPISMELAPFTVFWPAEDYHQDYVQHNPQNPYVQHESIPRLKKGQEQFRELLKPERSIVGH